MSVFHVYCLFRNNYKLSVLIIPVTIRKHYVKQMSKVKYQNQKTYLALIAGWIVLVGCEPLRLPVADG